MNLLASQVLRDICFGIPEFAAELDYFFSSFNVALAVRDGVVEMVPGSCPELDQAKAKVVDWEARFDAYLAGEEVRLKYSHAHARIRSENVGVGHSSIATLARRFIRLRCQCR